jgi:putative heme iron utilization protein
MPNLIFPGPGRRHQVNARDRVIGLHRVDEITGVRFVRGPYPFPSFPGREVLTVQFLGPERETVLHCYVHELYDGQRMRPEKLAAWQALRERQQSRRVENRASITVAVSR